jgi:uncharacterized protein (DUF1697 family)
VAKRNDSTGSTHLVRGLQRHNEPEASGSADVRHEARGTSPFRRREHRTEHRHNRGIALIAFLRGVNVGGHKTFRPSVLARELSDHDVVNVGAAGTFVVRRPGSRARFRAALLRKLPFEAEVVLCDGRDLMRLETENPFAAEPSAPDVVRFVTILSQAGDVRASLPVTFPSDGEWLVRVIASHGQFVCGMYRRHMRTIGYLGRIDKLFGAPATTRNWNTILAVVRILKGM